MVHKTTTRRLKKPKVPKAQRSRFMGIDQSLTRTGVVVADLQLRVQHTFCIPTNPKSYSESRLDFIGMSITSALGVYGKDLVFVALENLAFGGSGKLDILAGVYWEIRRRVWRYNDNMEIKSVPIGSWKKHVTGNGRAKKDLIQSSIQDRYGLTFGDENIYDAYGLLRFEYDKWVEAGRIL